MLSEMASCESSSQRLGRLVSVLHWVRVVVAFCRLFFIENLKIGLKKRWFMTTLVLLLKN